MAKINTTIVALENADYSYMAFTFNGKHSSYFGIYRVSDGNDGYQDKINLETREQTAAHAGVIGQGVQIGTYKPRVFDINIAFENLAENKLAEFRSWLSVNEEKELWFSETPYKVYKARVQGVPTLTIVPFSTSNGRTYKGTGKITFVCSNPYAYAPSGYTKNGADAELTDAANYNDFEDFYTENSRGTAPMPFVATLNGPCTTLTLIRGDTETKLEVYGNCALENALPPNYGWKFSGWNTKSDGTGENYYGSINVVADTVLYAQFTKVYLYLENNNVQTKLDWAADGHYSLEGITATPPSGGYKFSNWNTKEDGTGVTYQSSINIVTDTVLYARFAEAYLYLDNTPQTWNKEGTYTLAPLSPTGYDFQGWFTGENGTGNKKAGQITLDGADLKLYSYSTIKQFTVAWVKSNDTTRPNTETGPVMDKNGNNTYHYLNATFKDPITNEVERLDGLNDNFDYDGKGNGPIHTKTVKYGTTLWIKMINEGDLSYGSVTVNGVQKAWSGDTTGGGTDRYEFSMTITEDTAIQFIWRRKLDNWQYQSYWDTVIKTGSNIG